MGETTWKSRLMRYVYLEMEHGNNMDRLARLENDTELPAMQEGDGSQRSLLKSSRMENAAVRKLDQENKIRMRLAELGKELSEIEDAVDRLEDPMCREVLRLRYMDCESLRQTRWNDVALKIYGSDEEKYLLSIWRIHGNALNELERMMGN